MAKEDPINKKLDSRFRGNDEEERHKMYYIMILLILLPSIAHANLVWPALILTIRMYSIDWIWAIILGLLVEWFFYKQVTQQTWKRAAKMLLAANVASALLGVALIPISGIIWELVSAPIRSFLEVGTFYLGAWIATVVIAAFVNALIETASLKIFFKIHFSKKVLVWLFAANLISVTIVALTLIINMPQS